MTRGMTLLEVLVVIALVITMTATGAVALSELQAIFKLRSTADEIRSMLQLGRELAVANKDLVAYTISLSGGLTVLQAGSNELVRYLAPAGITFSPSTFTYGFTPLTGQLTGCALPCGETLEYGNNSELVTIQANGIVN